MREALAECVVHPAVPNPKNAWHRGPSSQPLYPKSFTLSNPTPGDAAHGPLQQRESRKHETTKVRNVEKSMIFCLCFGLPRFRVFVMVLGCGLAAFIGGLTRAQPGAA